MGCNHELVSLTLGAGPFGHHPGGRFNREMPESESLLYVEDSPRWVRTMLGGATVADSRRMKLLYTHGAHATYLFPREDVREDLLVDDHAIDDDVKGSGRCWSIRVGERTAEHAAREYEHPLLAGYVAFDWHKMDEWWEEEEQVRVHARDPYHRVDVLDTSRHVRITLGDEVLADTTRAKVLFETGLPSRWYIPQEDVRMELLESTDSQTSCPYKGDAGYWSLRAGQLDEADLVWAYREPFAEVAPIAGHLAFYNERVDIEIDGEREERPITPWSVPRSSSP
jgi:uncharacterized protein (DUF427 family)